MMLRLRPPTAKRERKPVRVLWTAFSLDLLPTADTVPRRAIAQPQRIDPDQLATTSRILTSEQGSVFSSDTATVLGTSFATPNISGVVALMLEANYSVVTRGRAEKSQSRYAKNSSHQRSWRHYHDRSACINGFR